MHERDSGHIALPGGRSADPGAALRAAREARGLSLEEVARTTKITVAALRALEHNEIEKLPAPVFTRGFLKAYAREVGLDPDATADRYLSHVQPASPSVEDDEGPRITREDVMRMDDDNARILAAQQAGRFGWLVTIAAAIGLVAYVWSFNWRTAPDTRAPAPEESIVAAPDATRAGGSGTGVPEAAAGAGEPAAPVNAALPLLDSTPLKIEFRPRGPCWLAANADGAPVVARLFQAGESELIEVSEELVLRVGDPATFVFSINGRAGRSLGRPGEPVNVRITKDNFREFLSS